MSDTTRILIELSEQAGLPARVPLLPVPGAYSHPTYGPLDITPERRDRFIANHNQRIYQRYLPIDAEHQTKLSGAVGYLGDAQVEADGSVSASVEWTPRGEALMAGGGFKYVSPEWYDRWTDPATAQTYDDVLIGLAITTRPFFKESALPPLVAREHGHVPAPTGGDDQSHGTQTVSVQSKENPVSEPQAITEAQVNEIVSRQLAEQATTFNTQITSLTERLQATETENVSLKNAERMKGFRDEVMGRSDANGTRWFGDIENHIKVLDALGDDDRKVYVEEQRKLAAMVAESGAFKEIGSAHGNPTTSAWDRVDAEAKTLREKRPELTIEQARTEVLETNSKLAAEVAAER